MSDRTAVPKVSQDTEASIRPEGGRESVNAHFCVNLRVFANLHKRKNVLIFFKGKKIM